MRIDSWRHPGADLTRSASSPLPDSSVVLVGHGSRDPAANGELEAFAAAYQAARPDLRVSVGYIELAQPLLGEALARAARSSARVTAVPLFLFAAGHVKNDMPLALAEARRQFPGVSFTCAPHLGVHPFLADTAHDRAATALGEGVPRDTSVLLVVGRGSSDPDANGDFMKLARLVGEGRGFMRTETAFIGITGPSLPAALDVVARMRPDRVVVVPYLLFAGRLVARIAGELDAFAASHSWIHVSLAAHLGADPRVLSLVDERVDQALSGQGLLPCDTCLYRTPFAGVAQQVGGLRALLYSVRHTLTHSQAALPVHAHRPLRKHVFVCNSTDCVDRGGVGVLAAMRHDVKASKCQREIRVTRTSCMGRCGEGPTVAVYPDGVFYRRVRDTDAAEIVREHLLGDRLVGRLVDDILQ